MHSFDKSQQGGSWRPDQELSDRFEVEADGSAMRRAEEGRAFAKPQMFEPPFYRTSAMDMARSNHDLHTQNAIETDLSVEPPPRVTDVPWAVIGVLGVTLAGMAAYTLVYISQVMF